MITFLRRGLRALLLGLTAALALPAAAQLALVPVNPNPVDTIRLRWTHVGCTHPDTVRVAMQGSQITVTADRMFVTGCGTTTGYFDEYTLGRLPAGEYDVQLIVNPPPPTVGPSLTVGPIHLVVTALPSGALPPLTRDAQRTYSQSCVKAEPVLLILSSDSVSTTRTGCHVGNG